ncbi:hypothetical protein JNW88_12015 [Micromonospora sp. ATA32]|nr:hypothetical protein [Micromonospora sp. ATA32]
MTKSDASETLMHLTQVFGGLRAEYLHEEMYDLFTHPTYWPELLSPRPCLLVGGRGTGKTTVLRGLSYEGQRRLVGRNPAAWQFVGVYWRVDTNAVRAFRGAGVGEEQWTRLFGHYVNLVLTQRLVEFLEWLNSTSPEEARPINGAGLERVCRALHLRRTRRIDELASALVDAIIDFEAYVNNAAGDQPPRLSMQGRPFQILVEELRKIPIFANKPFFFLLDEYENLEDYQQRAINTLIKHSSNECTFKVGMRETGHRERATLNPDEQLVEPADYAYIDIARRLTGSDFSAFAANVCNGRLSKVLNGGGPHEIRTLLPGISEAQEANALGIEAALRDGRRTLKTEGASDELIRDYDSLDPLQAYLVKFWAEAQQSSLVDTLTELLGSPDRWQGRLNNYQHSMLFTIRRGRRGIRKFYAGWDTFVQLSAGNIRYLLQLVAEALQRHIREGRLLAQPVTYETQTEAAAEIGRRNLHELQGLAAEGAQLTKLVLGLGRVFQVMAAQPHGHTPEVNQFHVNRTGLASDQEAEQLLRAAVMHLAVIRFTADKMAAASGEIKDFDYQLHPIFAPFFVYSHRRKRRLSVGSDELLDLVRNPPPAIRSILGKSNRDLGEELPTQLSLFKEILL